MAEKIVSASEFDVIPPPKKIRKVDGEDCDNSESEMDSGADEFLPPPPPPPAPPTVRTVNDEDIPESEISEYSHSCTTKYYIFGNRIFRNDILPEAEEEYEPQYQRFCYLNHRSQGFEINWDEFDFMFGTQSVAWCTSRLVTKMSNDELIEYLTRYAIDKHNNESEQKTNLVYVGPVMANFLCAAGYVFFITFRARDVLSPDPEPKLYQTKVRKFAALIDVTIFRPRPSDEDGDAEMTCAKVDPPAPAPAP
ncbi:PREDICTED: uncharacterized protein LOC104822259 isoform X1 [Tarenaya hassleriana]|uniref:uncharacterized protein LOC104822259 isoform X1 n=1 Tax=Tarenaya hassleriana TaxID=28532 RepID=UPI00053C6921|nr:PREDICTED: uncharacterized protein LOC104822259 isoform X1 [Tarenaya hassleriana]